MNEADPPKFIKLASGTWHYRWCTYVLPAAEVVEGRDTKPPHGHWKGSACKYCLHED